MSADGLGSDKAPVVYFIGSVLIVVGIVFVSLASVIQTKDHTMIHFPTVSEADRTRFTDEPTIVWPIKVLTSLICFLGRIVTPAVILGVQIRLQNAEAFSCCSAVRLHS